MPRVAIAFVLLLCAAGCIKAPLELQQAVKKQHEEIVQIRLFYNDAINKLFDEIERLQLHYVNQFEVAMVEKYKFKRGGDPGQVASDDDLNVVLVPIQARIHSFADERRIQIQADLANMRKQYLALNQSIDNADEINRDMAAYVDSLIRYRKAQDALGQALLQKVNSLAPAALPTVNTIGSFLKTYGTEFANAAQAMPPDSQK